MNEARRLLEAGSERERALLRAGADERPSATSVRAAAHRLGLAPAVALISVGSAVKGLRWSSRMGYVLAPTLGIVSLGLTALYRLSAPAPAVTSGVAATSVVAESPGHTTSATNAADPAAQQALASPAMNAPPPSMDSPGLTPAHPAQPATVRRSGLKEQLALIERARSLEASGDAAAALRAVEDYERRFAGGVLGEEASFIRLQAVSALGDRGRAVALAQRFVAEHPTSVYVDGAKAILRSP
jgi:hypothetical protein